MDASDARTPLHDHYLLGWRASISSCLLNLNLKIALRMVRCLNSQASAIGIRRVLAIRSDSLQRFSERTSRCLSSVDSPADAASLSDAAKLKLKTADQKPGNALFPWRHETSDNLLPRLKFGTPEYLADVRLPNDIQGMLAVLFLRVPFWKVFFGITWRDELAESCAFAFARGTAGIISNVYKLPFYTVNRDGTSIDFQFRVDHDKAGDDSKIEPKAAANEAPNYSDSNNADTDEDPNKDKEKDDIPDAAAMLDRPLRHIFQSAHESGRDQLIISLKSEPKRALLYTVFGVPFLTKARAEADTTLLNRIRELLSLVREDPETAFSGLNDFIRQESAWSKDKMETTIELQVLVECEEQFQVRDRKTGVLLQGTEDGLARTVMHLVRLETNVSWRGRFPRMPTCTQENWRITDIDDLVGSQKWYHKH
jgi:hypothetical protein